MVAIVTEPTPQGLDLDQPVLTIIIVNYQVWPDVSRLVSQLATAPEVGRGACEIVIVDNASGEPVPAELTCLPGVCLVMQPENGGFAAGVNAGWRAARGRWCLLLNPDVLT